MSQTSSPSRQNASYDPVAKSLHWLTAVLLFCQFPIAWTMPEIHRDTVPERMINLHLSFGAVILAVMVLRLIWRVTHAAPPYEPGIPRWQIGASHALHWTLYFLLTVGPLLGWINASWRGFSVTLFGIIELPKLIATRADGWRWTGDVHGTMTELPVLILVALHIGAALYHKFVRKDGVLGRML